MVIVFLSFSIRRSHAALSPRGSALRRIRPGARQQPRSRP